MPTRAAIVDRAIKYVGYREGPNNQNIFSSYLGLPSESWCFDFCVAIYKMSGLPLPSMELGHLTGASYVPDGWAYAKQHGATRNSWQAQPGDLVCFDWTGTQKCDNPHTHIGIVDHWQAGTLHTIEGNTGSPEGVYGKPWPAPRGVGNNEICGVINTGKLVRFTRKAPPENGNDVPPFPRRILMLKSPLMGGDDVRRWQAQMQHRGWRLDASGEYDVRTRDVCVAFQQQKGLHVDGQVGPQTWAMAWTAPITPE
jgi:Putative peptidoglycan binding domain/CHAP domain